MSTPTPAPSKVTVDSGDTTLFVSPGNKSADATINVYCLTGQHYNGQVHMSVTGLPAGVTASFRVLSLTTPIFSSDPALAIHVADPNFSSCLLMLSADETAVQGACDLIVTGSWESGMAVDGQGHNYITTVPVSITMALKVINYIIQFPEGSTATVHCGANSGPIAIRLFTDQQSGAQWYSDNQINLTASATDANGTAVPGVQADFSPLTNPPAYRSNMTLRVPATVAAGAYNVIVTATSSNCSQLPSGTTTTRTATFNLNVTDFVLPGFSLSVSTETLSMQAGGVAVSATVSVMPVGGLTVSSVTLTADSILPSGPTATYNSTTGTMTVTAGSSLAMGTYTVRVKGTSGSLSPQYVTITVNVAAGQTLYLTTQGSDGIWTFDMASRAKPTEIPSTAGFGFSGLVAVGNTFYLTTHSSDGIWTFDVGSRAAPTKIPSTAGFGFVGVVAVGNTLYLTTQGNDGIWTFDVVSRAAPTQIATTAGQGFSGLIAVGNILYLTTHGSDGIWTFNVVTRAAPTKIATTAGFGFVGLIAVGNILYLTTQGNDGIWTFDMGSGAAPTKIPSTAGFGFSGLVAVNSIIYLTTHGSDGIWTFDLASRTTPTEIQSTAGFGFKGIMPF